jgi:hypothetical protein
VDTYLKAVKDEKVAEGWDTRDIEKMAFAWKVPGTTLPIVAKQKDDKILAPIPWSSFFR